MKLMPVISKLLEYGYTKNEIEIMVQNLLDRAD